MSQFAARLYTYPVPDAKNPMKVVKELAKITRPFLTKIYIVAGLQASFIIVMFVEVALKPLKTMHEKQSLYLEL